MSLLKSQSPPARKKYHPNAYRFLFAALSYTQESLGRRSVLDYLERVEAADGTLPEDDFIEETSGHISGRQLCEGIRRYALGQYGLLARTVFENWNIRSTRDFGEIVFQMVEDGEMRATPKDCIEDFDDVFDFEADMIGDYQVETAKAFA